MTGRTSRANTAHTGGHRANAHAKQRGKDAPPGQCWGCWAGRQDPWEHSTWCEQWNTAESQSSGT